MYQNATESFIGLTLMEYMAKSGKSLTDLIDELYEMVGSFKYGRNDLHLTEEKKQAVIKKCKEDPYQAFGEYEVKKD